MAAIKIKLDGDKHAFAPGDTIAGRAAWHFDEAPAAVELRLMWHTVGKGTTDAHVAQVVPLTGNGNWGDAPFSITAPQAPWSCDGTLVSICWLLELVAEPSDELDSVDIVIAPGCTTVALGAASRVEYDGDDSAPPAFAPPSDIEQAIVEWAAAEFQRDTGVDLRRDPLAVQRLREAAAAAAEEIESGRAAALNLPYVTADASGPKHMNYTVTPAQIENVKRNLPHDGA